MLAEIFMVRLEATARGSQGAGAANNSRFVPFAASSQFTFKESKDWLAERSREKLSTQQVYTE